MVDLEALLDEACRTGEIVEVIYHGGSQPGTRRDLQPLRVDPPYVEAMCLEANTYKTFRLDRMELAIGVNASAPRYRLQLAPASRDDNWSMEALANRLESGLPSSEWEVRSAPSGVSVHGRFKSGKPKKTPEFEVVRVGSGYTVRGQGGLSGRHYKRLDKAVELIARFYRIQALETPPLDRQAAAQPSALPPPLPRQFPPPVPPAAPTHASAPTSAPESRSPWRVWLYRAYVVLGTIGLVGACVRIFRYVASY